MFLAKREFLLRGFYIILPYSFKLETTFQETRSASGGPGLRRNHYAATRYSAKSFWANSSRGRSRHIGQLVIGEDGHHAD